MAAVMGRLLEVKCLLIELNKGVSFVNLDDILVDLKLAPDVLEVPVPKYFVEDQARALEEREKLLDVLQLQAAQALAAGKARRGAEDKRRTYGVLKAELYRAALEVLFGQISSMRSSPSRDSSSGGNASRLASENSAWKNGRPAPRRMMRVGMSTAQGRSITVFAIFAQTPSPSLLVSILKENGSLRPVLILGPRIARTAGRTINE